MELELGLMLPFQSAPFVTPPKSMTNKIQMFSWEPVNWHGGALRQRAAVSPVQAGAALARRCECSVQALQQ